VVVVHAETEELATHQRHPLDTRPVLPPFKPPTTNNESILPIIPLPTTPDTQGLLAGQRLFVRQFKITGNTVLTDQALVELTQPYLNREVLFDEFSQLRDEITRAYVDKGYINSGAVIPPQTVKDGVIEIKVIEGRLVDIEYKTNGRLRESYVRHRLQQSGDEALNVYQLEQRLQQLQQDDRIQSVQAALVPTGERGKSHLRLTLIEATPIHSTLHLDNYETPSVGAEAIRLNVAHNNLSGYGDRLEAGFDRSEGLWSANGRYQVSPNAGETLFDLHVTHSESEVIEAPFDRLDINSESSTFGLTMSHAITNTLHRTLRVSVAGAVRRSKSFLLGQPFSFSEGAEKGESKVTALRFGLDWSQRSGREVFVARSLLSVGIDALDATVHAGNMPDSEFSALLLQGQWARRLQWWNAQVFARGDLQLTNTPLLGLEQFSIGGHATVRGYRESTLVRDQGWVVSVEGRVPLWQRRAARFDVGVFADAGRAWNIGRVTSDKDTLASVGLGLRYVLNKHFNIQLDWAKQLENVPDSADDDFQDDGVHFRLSAEY